MYELTVLNPVSELQDVGAVQTEITPRPKSLEGLTVGLVWNRKRGGNAVLERVGERLRERFTGIELKTYHGSIPSPQTLLDQAAEECDVAIGSSSD